MDDEQYRQAREAIEQPRCLYEKALQYGYFSCRYACKIALGEREAMHCSDPIAHSRCAAFYALTLKKSGFALGTTLMPTHLTFNKAMKVQIGGLRGAAKLASMPVELPEKSAIALAPDVAACLERIQSEEANFETVDFSEIVPHIQKFSMRRRRRSEK